MSTLNVPLHPYPIAVDVCTTYSRHYALLRVQYLLLGPDFLILYLGWSKKNVSSNNLFRPMPARELFSPRVTSRHTSLPLLLDRRLFRTTTELKKKILPSKAMPLYTPILKKKQLTTERPFSPLLPSFFFSLYTHSPGISPAARACNGCLVIKLRRRRRHRIFPPLARRIFMFIFCRPSTMCVISTDAFIRDVTRGEGCWEATRNHPKIKTKDLKQLLASHGGRASIEYLFSVESLSLQSLHCKKKLLAERVCLRDKVIGESYDSNPMQCIPFVVDGAWAATFMNMVFPGLLLQWKTLEWHYFTKENRGTAAVSFHVDNWCV